MKNEQLAIEIFQEIIRNATQTKIENGFAYWDSQYHGYPFCNAGDAPQEKVDFLDRLKRCFDEAKECCRAKVDPQVWEMYKKMFKNNAQRAESDRPLGCIAEDDDMPF